MRTDVIQVVSLATYAIPVISGRTADVTELYPLYPTFEHVQSIDFDRPNQGQNYGGHTNQVAAWIRRLKREGVEMIMLNLRDSANPESDWGFVTDGNRGFELWHPTWKRRSGSHELKARYSVIYTAKRFQRLDCSTPKPLSDALEAVHAAIETFSKSEIAAPHSKDLSIWRELDSIGTLSSLTNHPIVHPLTPTPLAIVVESMARLITLFDKFGWSDQVNAHSELKAVWDATMQVFEATIRECGNAQSSTLAA